MADLIDRQAAIDAILSIKDYGNSERANALGLAELAVTTLPSVQPEQKTGRWITDYLVGISGASYRIYRCSECAAYYESVGLWPRRYCPNCGAKMDEEEEHGTTD